MASIIIWLAVLIIHLTSLPILTKNLLTFFAVAPLMPLAFLVSKIIKIDFQNKGNPLGNLGLLFSWNQFLYLLIAMWIYSAVPDKMLMIIAMIYGAHLLPYGWLYKSKAYMVNAVIVPILALAVSINFEPYILVGLMILIQIIFTVSLFVENKQINRLEYDFNS